jgi:hypothetical protein
MTTDEDIAGALAAVTSVVGRLRSISPVTR